METRERLRKSSRTITACSRATFKAPAEPATAISELARLAAVPAADSTQLWVQLAGLQAEQGDGAAALRSIDRAIDLARARDDPAALNQLKALRTRIVKTPTEK